MRLSIAATLILLGGAPGCQANELGTSPLIIFRAGAARTTEVGYTKTANVKTPDVAYEFVPVNGDKCAAHYRNTGSGLVYDPPAPVVMPKWDTFADALEDDPAVPMQVHQYLGILQRNVFRPARCQGIWARIKGAGLPWLTATAISAIEAHANTNLIPLVK